MIKVHQLEERIQRTSGKIVVMNFWATWCGPCVNEMPLFDSLCSRRKTDVDVMLISMDFDLDPDPKKVWNFIDRKKILAPVYLLDENDPNEWINKIDERWTGVLPATLIVNPTNGKKMFVEGELHDGDLERLIADIAK